MGYAAVGGSGCRVCRGQRWGRQGGSRLGRVGNYAAGGRAAG